MASLWPFNPDHITADGGAPKWQDAQLELGKLTGIGILTNEYLQGIQTRISADLDCPTTVVEFAPTGHPVRTDSKLLRRMTRPPCLAFRACTHQRHCFNSDNQHAALLYGLKEASLESDLRKRVADPTLLRMYPRGIEPHMAVRVDPTTGRSVLEYDCPMLGYRELLHPVCVEQRVVAAFIVGQILISEREAHVLKTQSAFFRENPFALEWTGYREEHIEVTEESLEDHIVGQHKRWFMQPGHQVTEQEYSAIVRNSCELLAEFEDTLRSELMHKRQLHIAASMRKHSEAFQGNLARSLKRSSDDAIAGLWAHAESALQGLIEDFNFEYALVFGVDRLLFGEARNEALRVVAKAGDIPEALRSHLDQLRYPSQSLVSDQQEQRPDLPRVDIAEFVNVTETPYHFSYPHERIWQFPMRFLAYSPGAIIIGYRDKNPQIAPTNAPGTDLDRALESFWGTIVAALSALVAGMSQQKMEETLKVFSHELAAITSGMNNMRRQYFETPELLRSLNRQKAEDVCCDMTGFMNQAYHLTETPKLILSVPKPHKQHFWAYKELLFKWKDMYRLDAFEKDVQFVVLHPSPEDPERPPVWGDQAQLEELLYNLVNNALKYCYRGTKIHVDCQKVVSLPGAPHLLTVTDYGKPVVGGEALYELFRRGPDNTADGLGVGLNIAQRIADAHGGKLRHDSDSISAFNVPLLQPYLRSRFADSEVGVRVQAELVRLKALGLYGQIVSLDDRGNQRYAEPTTGALEDLIELPTYRVVFTVRIPAQEGSNENTYA